MLRSLILSNDSAFCGVRYPQNKNETYYNER